MTDLPVLIAITPNFHRLDISPSGRRLSIWFSYGTPIAFQKDGHDRVYVRENEWGGVTARHMNCLVIKEERIDGLIWRDMFLEAMP